MHMRGYQSGTNPDVAVIIPSTGRAEQCARLVERIHETARTGPSIVVSVEPDDQQEYSRFLGSLPDQPRFINALVWPDDSEDATRSHVAAINRGARSALAERFIDENESDPKLIIKLDDDHWPVTHGWDQFYLDSLNALGGTGVVYGNDLFQRDHLPTAPGLSTDIVRELGWYAPPQLGHLFCDNFWLELGRRSGRLSYMPNVIIEHRHPVAGWHGGQGDATYEAGGMSPDRWSADEREWRKMIKVGGADPISSMEAWARRVARLAEWGSSR